MKKYLACLLIMLSLLGIATTAFAAQGYKGYTLECEGNAVMLIERSNDRHYFFLPGSWAGRQVVIRTERPLWINGEGPYQDGDQAPEIVNGDVWTVRVGKETAAVTRVCIQMGSAIPALFVRTDSGRVYEMHKDKERKEPGDYSLMYPLNTVGAVVKTGNDSGELEYIKCRGNTTFGLAKKPYQIKLMDKTSLCGMQKAKKWILLADHWDISLLRNKFCLELAKAVGIPYAVDCQHVDLYINAEYRGLYLLTEKIEIGGRSVDIVNMEDAQEALNSQPLEAYATEFFKNKKRGTGDEEFGAYRAYVGMTNPSDITGGYLLECDKLHRFYEDGEMGVITSNAMAVTIKEPEYASYEMVMYIGEKVNAFHRAILTKDGVDPITGVHWDEIMDMESLAMKYLMEEFSENYDGLAGSQFFYKDVDAVSEKIFAGPCWDYDLTFGNAAHNPSRLYLRSYEEKTQFWYSSLHRFEEFDQMVADLWVNTYSPVVHAMLGDEPNSEITTLDEYAEEIRLSAEMNFMKWSIKKIEGRHPETGSNFSSAVIILKDYAQLRMNYLDHAFAKPQE